ncbi:MAG: amino acid ABC transporter permease [Burkholderiales bacterium]
MTIQWKVFLQQTPDAGARYIDWLLSGLAWTVALALTAWIVALALGFFVGVIRTLPQRWVVWVGDGYVELFRNVPLLVQLFLWYFVLPEILPQAIGDWIKGILPPWGPFFTSVLCLALFTSARIAEQVKAGISALPRGQKNAALAVGMTLPQVYRNVLLPQAVRLIIPPLTSEFMTIFKNSSVALTIGLLELTAQARQMNEFTFKTYEAFGAATVLYLITAMVVNRLMAWVERRSRIPGLIGQGGH